MPPSLVQCSYQALFVGEHMVNFAMDRSFFSSKRWPLCHNVMTTLITTIITYYHWRYTTTIGFLVSQIEQVPCRHRCECQRHDCGLGPWIQQVVLMDFNGKLIEDIEVNQGKGVDPCWSTTCFFSTDGSLMLDSWIISKRPMVPEFKSHGFINRQQTQGDRLSHPRHLCILTRQMAADGSRCHEDEHFSNHEHCY